MCVLGTVHMGPLNLYFCRQIWAAYSLKLAYIEYAQTIYLPLGWYHQYKRVPLYCYIIVD